MSDLANCTGQTKCFNNTTNTSVSLPENSYTQAKVTTGAFGQVVTTTNFSDPALDVNAKCAGDRTGATIGSAIDARVIGDLASINSTKPTTTMVMIIPIKTLKFYGLTARNAAAYNVCLGAMRIDGATSGIIPWKSIDKKGKQKASSPSRRR